MDIISRIKDPGKLKQLFCHVTEWRVRYLSKLEEILRNLLEIYNIEDQLGKQTTICWDWDMIRNYMYNSSSSSVFAGALAGALAYQEEAKHKIKIIILPGTRSEMIQYLSKKASQYRKARLQIRRPIPKCTKQENDYGILNRPEWESIRTNIDMLMDYESIRRLRHFLSKHAITLHDANPQIDENLQRSQWRTKKYKKTLTSFSGRWGDRRNRADALNISLLLLSKKKGIPSQLITGTKLILDQFNQLSSDPFTSMLYYVINNEYKTPRQCKNALRRWLKNIDDLIDRSDVVGAAVSKTGGPLSRQAVENLISALKIYKHDESFAPLIDALTKAETLARSRSSISRLGQKAYSQIRDRLPETNMRTVEASISELLDTELKKSSESLEDIGCRWKAIKSAKQYRKWLLIHPEWKTFDVSIETIDGRYSIYWPVSTIQEEFIMKIEDILNSRRVPFPKTLIIETLNNEGHATYVEPRAIHKKWKLHKNIVFSSSCDIIKIRVSTEHGTIYWEIGNIELNRSTNIAVVSNDSSFRWFISLIDETASEALPPEALKRAFSAKLIS